MNTLSYKTISAKKETVQRKWYVFDAEGEVVGRMSSRIASVLRGKHKPDFTPHVDTGDYVIIINADKVRFTGDKLLQKEYITYSGYPGGQKRVKAGDVLENKKIEVYRKALEQAIENDRITTNKYKNSLVNIDDLLEAEAMLLTTKINVLNARADAVLAHKKLLQTTGILVD